MKRPLLVLGLTSIVTTAVMLFVSLKASFAVLIVIALAAIFYKKQSRGIFLRSALCGFIIAAAACSLLEWRFIKAGSETGKDLEFSGYVISVSQYNSRYYTVAAQINDSRRLLKAGEYSYDEDPYEVGDWIEGTVNITDVETDTDYMFISGGLLSRGVMKARETEPPERKPLFWHVYTARASLIKQMSDPSRGEGGALAVSILFSGKELLSQELIPVISRTGAGHITAVSGLHLSILLGIVLNICRSLSLGRGKTALLGAVTIFAVCAMAAFSTPVLRAGIMSSIYLAGTAIRRRGDPITSLAAAATVLTAFSPALIADVSFWMSFSATAGVILFAPVLTEKATNIWLKIFGKENRIAGNIFSALSVTFGAQIAVAPITAATFGYLSVYSILTNILIIPLVFAALASGFCSVIFFALGSPTVGGSILNISSFFCEVMIKIFRWVDSLPLSTVPQMDRVGIWLLWAACAAIGARILLSAAKKPVRAIFTAAASLICAAWAGVTCVWYFNPSVISCPESGALLLRKGDFSALVVDTPENSYDRYLIEKFISRCAASYPKVIIYSPECPLTEEMIINRLYEPEIHISTQEKLILGEEYTGSSEKLAFSEQIQTVGNELKLSLEEGHRLGICYENVNIVKCWAGYGIITEDDIGDGTDLVAGFSGRLFSPTGEYRILNMGGGYEGVLINFPKNTDN